MICPEFLELSPEQKVVFIGKLIHAVQNDSVLFNLGEKVVDIANDNGMFARVEIAPSNSDVSTAISDLDNPIERNLN